ncbi:DNA polymerase alpha subunit B-like [Tubulanus polymorphus]|uniref:DNA polymerase alpha subunit B-like n=1 Tax=Tubulanus polymorphus TaxID=672921 RepID=UPI003DA23212
MVVNAEDLFEEFSPFGVSWENEEITDKLLELCSTYGLDASDMVDEWVAFSTSASTIISLENLLQFERSKLLKKVKKVPRTPIGKIKKSVYNSPQAGLDEDVAEELFDKYSTPATKKSHKRQHTPDTGPVNKRLGAIGGSPVVPFSPNSFSPAGAETSEEYASRPNSGKVECSHGGRDIQWKNTRGGTPPTITSNNDEYCLDKGFKFMFQKFADQVDILNYMIEEMGLFMREQYKLSDDEQFSHVGLPAQDEVTVCGRICCDSVGKLNSKSVVLQGSQETSSGRTIPLDLTELQQYSLFPGQVVVMNGINNIGNRLVVKKLYEPIMPPPIGLENVVGPLNVMVACGPFTTSTSLAYEPLVDLIKVIQEDSPDVCIFLGPFIDCKNKLVQDFTDSTYDEMFANQIKQIVHATERCNTQLIFVPSSRDVHHDFIYPQPPFLSGDDSTRVHMVSDPCTFSINGLIIGLTSTDVLLHLGGEEISVFPPGSTDRLTRLCKHIISQRSYYPLYPPGEDVNLEFETFENHARLPSVPHILLVPSDLRYFIKEVSKCCCINPGRLAKGKSGGTYARFYLPHVDSSKPLFQQLSAQVLKI